MLTKSLSKELKKRIVKVLVWPVVMYGCETWTLRKAEIDKLEALEIWIWIRLENISWEEKIRNEEVLRRVKENRCLMTTIYRRQKNWIGHTLRGDGLLRDVMGSPTKGRAHKNDRQKGERIRATVKRASVQ